MRVVLAADFPVHCLPHFEDKGSGHHATWLPPLAKEFSELSGFDFHWIVCSKDVSTYREIPFLNQTFHLIPRRKLSIEILTRFARERRLIGELVSELKPDLFHGWGTEQGYGLAANDFRGISLISLQGILTSYCKASRMPILTRIQTRTERAVLSKARHLTVESPWGAEQLKLLAPKATIDLLEYGADPACFEIERNPTEKPSAVFLGSLSHLKGVDTLLAAFSDPRLSGIELHIYGAGDPAFTQANHTPNIHFRGHRPRAEVLAALAQAWCLVHPTRADTSPNCVKEARVIGLPVITTPEGGQTQYVTHGQSGFIHEAGDVEGIIQGVLAVTADRETSLRLGEAGQQECRNLLTPARTARKMIDMYHRIV
ncbi:MAG: glycosyltransferase family 4 protein [Akkermansiaceae bacterium]|nr:glycosyltransferase family 4 protein [Akkermansiaceae bacterium]